MFPLRLLGLVVTMVAVGPPFSRRMAEAADAGPTHELASKKSAYLASKQPTKARATPARPGTQAFVPIYARNLHTHEIMPLEGPGITPAAHDRFFRCWFTDRTTDIADTLVPEILVAARKFGAREVQVISGFRHPKYNLMLRKKGHEVARDSQHMLGAAIDFTFPDVSARDVYRHMLEHHDGGVGFYKVNQFVHIDTGRKRRWGGT